MRRKVQEEGSSSSSGGQGHWEEIIPVGVYIRALRYGYGAPVYGNTGSSDQSATGKLLKYHRVQPASPCKSGIVEEEPEIIFTVRSVPRSSYKREESLMMLHINYKTITRWRQDRWDSKTTSLSLLCSAAQSEGAPWVKVVDLMEGDDGWLLEFYLLKSCLSVQTK